jgi:hypothetical protein
MPSTAPVAARLISLLEERFRRLPGPDAGHNMSLARSSLPAWSSYAWALGTDPVRPIACGFHPPNVLFDPPVEGFGVWLCPLRW